MKACLAVAVLLMSASAWGATTQCLATFNNNQSDTRWCVTQNGNIALLSATGGNGSGIMIQGNEGYMIRTSFACYADNGQSDTGNWQASVVSEPKGPNTFPLTITRTTSDSSFTLTQKFSWGKNHSSIIVQMSLGGQVSADAFLWRYADVLYGGNNQWLDYTNRSAFIWSDGTAGRFGLLARSVPLRYLLSTGSDPNAVGGVQNLCAGIDGSKPQFPYQGDSALALFWQAATKGIDTAIEYTPLQ